MSNERPPRDRAAPRRTVWIVDDSPLEGEIARQALAEHFAVEVFADGAAVIERTSHSELPYVLVLDWVMPAMSGIDVCRFLRERSDTLPVLMLTARRETEDIVEGLQAGADDFLSKPFVPLELVARVRALATSRELRDRLAASQLENERRRADAAEEKARMTELYLGIIGHDFRNPLQAIAMASTVLARKLGANYPESIGLTNRITSSARRMTEMIEVLLDVTRTRLGGGIPIQQSPNDLRAMCEQIVQELRSAFPSREIVVEGPSALVGSFDYDRLSQVVSNLVSNALQHGLADSPVTVELGESGNERTVAVTNRGPTIDKERVKTLFDPFRRGEGAVPGSGLGLGLYISQQIVKAHGGEIDFQSSDQTTVTVRLPK